MRTIETTAAFIAELEQYLFPDQWHYTRGEDGSIGLMVGSYRFVPKL